jgi:succinate-acetate transporter protein
MGLLLWTAGLRAALIVHAVLAPLVFAAVAWSYFHRRGARRPLPTAAAFTGIVLVLDAAIGVARHDRAMFTSAGGFWLPLAMIFLVTWLAGEMMSMLPFPKRPHPRPL